jgi:inositol-pentakisphosphate 2-kinase
LPNAKDVFPPEAAAVKSAIGRFTLHQHYRGKSSTWYDPLDLYSGDDARMEEALDGLLHDWLESGGKANNLRVFVDGKAVAPPVCRIPDQAELFYWHWPSERVE